MAVELLAPAGSVDALRAACIAGADAVYIGGNRYGARAYADNPDTEDLLHAISLIHRLGKKLYLTVNTLLKDEEMEEVCAWMRPFYEQGVDAVIVQDLGVIRAFRETFPDLPLHASTQMAVTGAEGVRLLQKSGICRVVPARELSLAELAHIRKETGIELETFIHGALCYSYSGQCLMSSMIGGRSGNRGRCAGICRLPYRTHEKDEKNGRECYPLNMKDLCTLHLLPDLVEAGISSFKIEGRMKKPEYTAGVVSVYRRALDAYLSGTWKQYDSRDDLALLTALYNRDGFTDGYYVRHNGRDMIALNNEKLQGKRAAASQKAAEQIRAQLSGREAERALQMPVKGVLRLRAAEPAFCRVTAELGKPGRNGEGSVSVCMEGEPLDTARSAPSSEEQIRMQFMKTGGSPFYVTDLQTDAADNIFIPVRTLKELRRGALDRLEEAVQEVYSRRSPENRETIHAPGTAFTGADRRSSDAGRVKIYASVRELPQAEALLDPGVSQSLYAVCLPPELQHMADPFRKKGIKAVLALPYVLRRGSEESLKRTEKLLTDSRWDGVLIRDLEEAGLLFRLRETGRHVPEECILDAVMYTMNSGACAEFADMGFPLRTLPYELNFRELRRQETTGSQIIIYGRTPMMISAQCVRKTMGNCLRDSGWTYITDRTGKDFPVYCSCEDCVSILYNSLPLSLLKEKESIRHLGCGSVRMDFTDEGPELTARTAAAVISVFGQQERQNEDLLHIPVTHGHFRRGVE